MAMTPLPTPAPNLQNNTPEQFTQNVDALLGALPAFVNEANALEDNVNDKELSAANAAQVALESKLIAEESAQTASTKAQESSASAASALDSKNAVLNVEANQAIDVLNAIKTVDGSGSGLDADTVDGMQTGQSGVRYIPYSNAIGNVLIGRDTDNGVDKLQVNGSISAGTAVVCKTIVSPSSTTWVSTGINVNGGVGGKTVMITASHNGDTGDLTRSTFAMVRCGHSGDNATLLVIVTNGNSGGDLQISVVSSILHVRYSAGGSAVFKIETNK